MRVAAIQFDLAWESPQENFARATPLLEQAAAGGAQLLLLPEMFSTGFSMDAAKCGSAGEATRAFLRDSARRLRVHVAGGHVEPSSPRPSNALSLFAPDGSEPLHYRKLHPFSLAGEERAYLAAGFFSVVFLSVFSSVTASRI